MSPTVTCSTMLGIAALFFAAGCGGGNELIGSWTASASSQGTAETVIIDFEDSGSATFESKITELIGAKCSGSLKYTGYKWTSTDTTVTITGNGACTTSLACTGPNGQQVPIPCTPKKGVSGTCHYKLENNDDGLEISDCTNDTTMTAVTYARVQ